MKMQAAAEKVGKSCVMTVFFLMISDAPWGGGSKSRPRPRYKQNGCGAIWTQTERWKVVHAIDVTGNLNTFCPVKMYKTSTCSDHSWPSWDAEKVSRPWSAFRSQKVKKTIMCRTSLLRHPSLEDVEKDALPLGLHYTTLRDTNTRCTLPLDNYMVSPGTYIHTMVQFFTSTLRLGIDWGCGIARVFWSLI